MRGQSKIVTFLSGLVLIGLALSGVSITGCQQKGDIKIGFIMPLTGEAGSLGEDGRNGMELAVAEINDAGGIHGRKIVVFYEDDQGKPDQAVNAIRKLISQNGVKFIVGPLFSSTTLAAAPIAEENKVILFSPGASNPKITDAGDYIFRNYPSDNYEGGLMARYAFNTLGYKKIAILYVNNDYGVGLKEVFTKEFEAVGGKIVAAEAYEQGASDFRTVLAKVKAAQPDAIYLPGYYGEIAKLAVQAREMGLKQQLLGAVGLEDPKIIELGGSAVEGILYTTPSVDLKSPREVVQKFVKAFRARFGKDPGFPAMHTYDTMLMLAKAMEEAGFNPDAVKNALYGIRDFEGVTGTITIDKNGDVLKPFFVKKIVKGKFTIVEKELK